MSRIIEARGPVVEALKRYDPGLRVRWSHEKKKWAIDAPYNIPNPNEIAKPVKFYRVGEGDHWLETLLPEYSERNFEYKDKRYVVAWAKKVTWSLLQAIANHDTYRHRKGAVGMLNDELKARDTKKAKDFKSRRDDRVYEGWHQFKHNLRRNPNLEDGTGTSIKGMKWEAA